MIWSYLKKYRNRIIYGTTVKLLFGTVTELFLPYLLAGLIDTAVPSRNIKMIYMYGGLMILAAITCWTANIFANRLSSWTSAQVIEKMRQDLFSRIMFLSVKQIDDFTVPSLESRITSDTYNVHRFITIVQRAGVRAPMLFLGGVFFCFLQNIKLALILVVLLPPIVFVLFGFSKKSFPLFKNVQHKLDYMTRIVRENISGIKIIRAMNRTDAEKMRFKKSSDEVSKAEEKAVLLAAKTNPLINLILYFGITVVILCGAFMVNSGEITSGIIISFLSYFMQITNSLLTLNRIFLIYNKAASSAARIEEVLKIEDKTYNDEIKISHRINKNAEPLVEFKNVNFNYNLCGGKNILHDISFSIKKGETIGIIGATGSGKSTILKLVLGLYAFYSGEIYWHGQKLCPSIINEMRDKISVVFQNDFLYSASILENITFGEKVPNGRIEQSVQTAQAADFIYEKGGLSYKLAVKASDLSGGQKQRILISRALIPEQELLILDDAASALDYETDAKFRNALTEYRKNKKTAIIIATQRISSIKNADKIIVLQNGRIINSGTHNRLLSECSVYSEIYKNQIGSFTV